jgi:hypothetical protein
MTMILPSGLMPEPSADPAFGVNPRHLPRWQMIATPSGERMLAADGSGIRSSAR